MGFLIFPLGICHLLWRISGMARVGYSVNQQRSNRQKQGRQVQIRVVNLLREKSMHRNGRWADFRCSVSGDWPKGPVDWKQIRHGQKLHFTSLTQIVPTSGEQSHPEATSYSMSCHVPALRARFSTNQNGHHAVLLPRTVGVKCKGMLYPEPITWAEAEVCRRQDIPFQSI